MTDDSLMTDDLILARTPAGQMEAIAESADIDPDARRLLLRATGHSPLSILLPGLDDATRYEHASALLERGLAEQVVTNDT